MKTYAILAWALVGVPLAACSLGGGGGGDSAFGNALIAPVTAAANGDTADPNVAVGASVVADATYQPQTNSVAVSWDRGAKSGKTRTFQLNSGVYTFQDTDEVGLLGVLSSTEYAAAVLGGVVDKNDVSGAVGLAAVGSAPTNIPTTGTLTYSATDAVVAANVAGSGLCGTNCIGDVSMTANFANGDVDGTLSNFSGGMSNVGFSGTMDSGHALYAANSLTYGGSAASGKLIGGFFGPGAEDTAGVFDLTTSGSVRLVGGYAASSEK